MAETYEIKVSLVTRFAKKQLQRLRADRAKTRETALSRIKTSTRGYAKQIAGAGAGYLTVGNLTRKLRAGSAKVDPWEQSLVPLAAALQQTVDEKVGFSAKARRAARDDVVGMLAANVGAGANVKDAGDVYRYRLDIREREERGRNIVRQQIKGPSLDELIVAATKGYFEISKRAWAYWWDRIFG